MNIKDLIHFPISNMVLAPGASGLNDPIKIVDDLLFPFDIGEVLLMCVSSLLYCSFVSLIIKP